MKTKRRYKNKKRKTIRRQKLQGGGDDDELVSHKLVIRDGIRDNEIFNTLKTYFTNRQLAPPSQLAPLSQFDPPSQLAFPENIALKPMYIFKGFYLARITGDDMLSGDSSPRDATIFSFQAKVSVDKNAIVLSDIKDTIQNQDKNQTEYLLSNLFAKNVAEYYSKNQNFSVLSYKIILEKLKVGSTGDIDIYHIIYPSYFTTTNFYNMFYNKQSMFSNKQFLYRLKLVTPFIEEMYYMDICKYVFREYGIEPYQTQLELYKTIYHDDKDDLFIDIENNGVESTLLKKFVLNNSTTEQLQPFVNKWLNTIGITDPTEEEKKLVILYIKQQIDLAILLRIIQKKRLKKRK